MDDKFEDIVSGLEVDSEGCFADEVEKSIRADWSYVSRVAYGIRMDAIAEGLADYLADEIACEFIKYATKKITGRDAS